MSEQETKKDFGELVLHEARPINVDGTPIEESAEHPTRWFIRDSNTGSFVYTSVDKEAVTDVKDAIEAKRSGKEA